MKIDLPRQNNYQIALENAWERLAGRTRGELAALGAAEASEAAGGSAGSGRWLLRVLDGLFEVDTSRRRLSLAGQAEAATSKEIDVAWRILALHYLAAPVPLAPAAGTVSFEQIADARGYAPAYNARVIDRFCHTAGADREKLLAAAKGLGAGIVPGGDLSLRLVVFPRLPVTIVWYAGDDELPPGASFLYEDNITSIFAVEDIVVTAERVVSRLCGKPW